MVYNFNCINELMTECKKSYIRNSGEEEVIIFLRSTIKICEWLKYVLPKVWTVYMQGRLVEGMVVRLMSNLNNVTHMLALDTNSFPASGRNIRELHSWNRVAFSFRTTTRCSTIQNYVNIAIKPPILKIFYFQS